MIATGLLPGALGGTRTPNLQIRSKIPAVQISPWLPHMPARWVADGCGIQLHPALSISVVSKSVSKGLASWLSWPERAPAYSPIPIDNLGFRKSIASFLGLA